MPDSLEDWDRPHFRPSDGRPFLFYVAFGPTPRDFTISASRYRCGAVPEGVKITAYGPGVSPEVLDDYRNGYLWDRLQADDPALARQIGEQTECLILIGSPADSPHLNHLRDVVGLLEWLFDNGAVGVFDPLAFRWWNRADWRREVFEPGPDALHSHVAILASSEADDLWLHTRGMRKFGRPDLSVRRVPEPAIDATVAMINRFITLQALGGVIENGQPIRMAGLPAGMTCRHAGHLDDPDFNNVHVEILWPAEA